MEFNCPSLSRHKALYISMDNPEIQGRIKIERVIPVEIFRKKSNTFRGITFFPVFTETTEIFCTICLDYQCQASSREKANNLPVFCKWNNSIPFLFLVPKKYQYHLTEIFHRNFRTNGKRSYRFERNKINCILRNQSLSDLNIM